MSISLNLQSVDGSSPVNNLHNVQCEIVHNGSASVKDHFLSAVKETEHGLTSSIRGRPVDGQKLAIPDPLVGLVLKEKRKPFTHEEDREIHVVQTFDSFTYWNLDSKPSCNDTMHTVMHWPKMSKAIHNPIPTED